MYVSNRVVVVSVKDVVVSAKVFVVLLCDPIWHVSSCSGLVFLAQTAIRFFNLLVVIFSTKVVVVFLEL